MKKQFFRVKQLADQHFLKADRSESLNSDELKKADGKVEFIQKALSELHKKLPVVTTEGIEKRRKKYHESILGQCMKDLSDEIDNSELLHRLFLEFGNAENSLAQDLYNHEEEVEQTVTNEIATLLANELPNINKLRKNLNKNILDKDSATNRYQSATKNSGKNGLNNNLKDDMDEADIKVDQNRDALAIEMFGLLKQQNKISMSLLQLLRLQKFYHENAYKYLEKVIPNLETMIGKDDIKPIFGWDLAEHLQQTDRKLALPLELCIVALMEFGMTEEGLFRVAGGTNRMRRLKLSIDSGCFSLPLIQEYRDVHVLASTLKLYLRELPEPLLTYGLYEEWMQIMSYSDNQRVKAVQEVLKKLPEENRNNLAFLMHFLAKLSKHSENKMTTSNISIVIAPNLLWTNKKELNTNMKNCTTINMIVELFLNHVHTLFPDDLMSEVKIRKEDLYYKNEECKPVIKCVDDYVDTASPKPISRKKTKPAPRPPPNLFDVEVPVEQIIHSPSYPSGSSTLNRSHKIRSENSPLKSKAIESSSEEINALAAEDKQHNLVNSPKIAELKSVMIQANHINLKPSKVSEEIAKPVAAPRTSIPEANCVRRDSISKSMNSIDIDGESVLIRRDDFEKPSKPAIPTRPASLRAVTKVQPDIDPQKCLIYNTPHKQQPSLVNIPNKTGHDNQMAEKEKFLLQPLNKFGDINSNRDTLINKPNLPTKPYMKSNEKLNCDEKVNGNKTSHSRTRSDGNIVDVPASLLQTPPSPRSLNKPSQPPPPPPTSNKTKTDAESTTF